jgi:dolichyl-diphosphooligosaccharide--protein glycosyltransferase
LTALSSEFAVLNTTQGIIKIHFFPNAAPNTVKNFETLAKKGFYDGTIFHRIIPAFVIQGGDPNTKPGGTGRDQWGLGDPGYKINEEFNAIPHHRGIVSMARAQDPNSAGSQFFIVLQDSDFLDGQYTVFGEVTDGMDVVDKIAALPTSTDPATVDQPVNPDDARVHSITIVSNQVTPEFPSIYMAILVPIVLGAVLVVGRRLTAGHIPPGSGLF